MNKRALSIILFVVIAYTQSSAQVLTRSFDSAYELDNIVGDYAIKTKAVTLPFMDKKALVKADEAKKEPGPFQFAVAVPVNINSVDHGVWSETETVRRWTLKLTSLGAFSQTLAFRKPQLPAGATLFIFDGDRKTLVGPIDPTNWEGKQEKLISGIIPGETAYIVFSEPITRQAPTRLEIMEVGYGYKDIFNQSSGAQDESLQDLNCPLGDNWRAEARSVATILMGVNFICTGVLVNNKNQDFTPYVLTADHCNCGGDSQNSVNFEFFLWAKTCNSFLRNVKVSFMNGAKARASRVETDFLLFEMNGDPSDIGVVYAGWDRTTTPASSSAGLHYPEGQPMRVLVENNPATDYASAYIGVNVEMDLNIQNGE